MKTNKNNLFRKVMVCSIIVLLIAAGLVPSIAENISENQNNSDISEELDSISVSEEHVAKTSFESKVTGDTLGDTLEDGLVGYWSFDEGSGSTVHDSSGNGNDGTIYGPTWTAGFSGSALEFDGSGDYVDVPDSIWGESLTLEATVKVYDFGTTNPGTCGKAIIFKAPDTGYVRDYSLFVSRCGDGEKRVLFIFGEDSTHHLNLKSNSILEEDVWYHIRVTRHNGVAKIYINGILDNSATYDFTPTNHGHNLKIGMTHYSGQSFDGIIDEVKIYSNEVGNQPPTEGLVGYWNFDEGSGSTAHDSSGNNNDGTINGASWTTGISGNALSFDGVDNYVEIPDDDILDIDASESLTVECWMKKYSSLQYAKLVNKGQTVYGTPVNAGYSLRFVTTETHSSNSLRFTVYDANNIRVVAEYPESSINEGEWYHVAGVLDRASEKIHLYVNGVNVDIVDLPTGFGSLETNIPVGIGALDRGIYGWVSNYFDGIIDEVRVYNRALSENGIKDHYFNTGLVGYWSFNEGSGSVAYDSSGYGNHGTIYDASWTDGISGYALDFDGINDKVVIPHDDSLSFENDFAIEAWVYREPSGLGSLQYIVSKDISSGSAPYSNYNLLFRPSNKIALFLYGLEFGTPTKGTIHTDAGGGGIVGETDVLDDGWHHIKGVYNGFELQIFLDGILDGAVPVTGKPSTNIDDVWIGMRKYTGNPDGFFKGIIDEVKISYNPTYHINFNINTDKDSYYPGEHITIISEITDEHGNEIYPINEKDFKAYLDNEEVEIIGFDNTNQDQIKLQIKTYETGIHSIKLSYETSSEINYGYASIEVIDICDTHDCIIPTFSDDWIYFESTRGLHKNEIYYAQAGTEINLYCDYELNQIGKTDIIGIKLIEYDYITNTTNELKNETEEVTSDGTGSIHVHLRTFTTKPYKKYYAIVESGFRIFSEYPVTPIITLFSGNIYPETISDNLVFHKIQEETDSKPIDTLFFVAPEYAQYYLNQYEQLDSKIFKEYQNLLLIPAMIKLSTQTYNDDSSFLKIMCGTDTNAIIRATNDNIELFEPKNIVFIGPYPSEQKIFQNSVRTTAEYKNLYGSVSRMGYSHVLTGFENCTENTIEFSDDNGLRGLQYYMPYKESTKYGEAIKNEITEEETPYLKINVVDNPSLTFSAAYSPEADGASIFTVAPMHHEYDAQVKVNIGLGYTGIFEASLYGEIGTKQIGAGVTLSAPLGLASITPGNEIVFDSIEEEIRYQLFAEISLFWLYADKFTFSPFSISYDYYYDLYDILVDDKEETLANFRSALENFQVTTQKLEVNACLPYTDLCQSVTLIDEQSFLLKDLPSIPLYAEIYGNRIYFRGISPSLGIDHTPSGQEIIDIIMNQADAMFTLLGYELQMFLGFTSSAEYLEQLVENLPISCGNLGESLVYSLEPGSAHTLIREATSTVSEGRCDTLAQSVKAASLLYGTRASNSAYNMFFINLIGDIVDLILQFGLILLNFLGIPVVASLDIGYESTYNLLKYTTSMESINSAILQKDLELLTQPEKINNYAGTHIIFDLLITHHLVMKSLGQLYWDEDLPIGGILYKKEYEAYIYRFLYMKLELTNSREVKIGPQLDCIAGISEILFDDIILKNILVPSANAKIMKIAETAGFFDTWAQKLKIQGAQGYDTAWETRNQYRTKALEAEENLKLSTVKVKATIALIKFAVDVLQDYFQYQSDLEVIEFNKDQLFYIGPAEQQTLPYDDPYKNNLESYSSDVNIIIQSHPDFYHFGNFSNDEGLHINISNITLAGFFPENQTSISIIQYAPAPGHPVLPGIKFMFKAPSNQTIETLNVSFSNPLNYSNVNLSSSKSSIKDTVLPQLSFNTGVYPLAQYGYEEQIIENETIIAMTIIPETYNASQKNLTFYQNISLNMSFMERIPENTSILQLTSYPDIFGLSEQTTMKYSIQASQVSDNDFNLTNITISVEFPENIAVSNISDGIYYPSNHTIIWVIDSLSSGDVDDISKYLDMNITSPQFISQTDIEMINISTIYSVEQRSEPETVSCSIPIFLIPSNYTDVTLSNIAITESLVSGLNYSMFITVKNAGSMGVGNIPLRITLNDSILIEKEIIELLPNETKIVNVTFSPLKPGIFNLTAAILQLPFESNLTNNIKSKTIYVSPPMEMITGTSNETLFEITTFFNNGCFFNITYPKNVGLDDSFNLSITVINELNITLNSTYINITLPDEINTTYPTSYLFSTINALAIINISVPMYAEKAGYGVFNITVDSFNDTTNILSGIVVSHFVIDSVIDSSASSDLSDVAIYVSNQNPDITYMDLTLEVLIMDNFSTEIYTNVFDLFGSMQTKFCSFSWNSTGKINGSHTFLARLLDNEMLLEQISFIIDLRNVPPVISDIYPLNNSINVSRPISEFNVTVSDQNGDNLTMYLYWINHSSMIPIWGNLTEWIDASNGTYSFNPPSSNAWIWGNTTYTWSVNVTDGTTWTNKTFTFTTGGSRYDVNNNDIVNFQDAGLVWIHRTSEVDYGGIYDVNQNGVVNFQDAGLTWVNRD